jgi:rhodanese-related sulfurtransferase
MKAISTLALPCVVLVALLLGAATATADHLAAVKVIDADELKAWIGGDKQMLLVDSRVAAEYREGHIPKAISIPAPTMDQHRDRLPRDLDHPLVFYCNGWPECKKSHEASSKAIQWGYRHVYWFRDGIPVWQGKGYPVE